MCHYRKIAGWLCIGLLAIGGASSLAAQNNAASVASEQSPVSSNEAQESQTAAAALWEELSIHVLHLLHEGKYLDAMPLAQKSVDVAKSAFGAGDLRLAVSLHNLAVIYKYQRKYAEAEPLYQQALEIKTKTLGSDHLEVATSLDDLAALYRYQRKYAEAEPLYQQALATRKKVLGVDHRDVAASLKNLAALYFEEGKYAEAASLLQQALAINKKALGSDHPDVATDLNNLGLLYRKQGKYGEAEPLFKQALEIRKKTLGLDHPDVIASLNNLAELYTDQRKYAEAEPFYKEALEIKTKTLGADHLEVATSLDALAAIYMYQRKYAEAEPLYQQALAIRKKARGPDHPDVAASLNKLVALYWEDGQYAEAESLLQQALAINKKTLGSDHPDVVESMNNLAALYYQQGKYAEAEPLYQQALAIDRKALGSDDPHVARDLNNLAALYTDQGRYAEAEPVLKEALEIRKKARAPDDLDVATSFNALAVLYANQRKYAEAEPLYQQALAIDRKALGPDDPHVARDLNNLAALYFDQGKYGEAGLLFQQALAIDRKALEPDDREVATILHGLALIYLEEGKYAEAEPLLKQTLETVKNRSGPNHPNVVISLGSLAALYYSWKRPEQAEAYFDSAFQVLYDVIEKQFAYMSENDRLSFLNTADGIFPAYSSFVYSYRDRNRSSVGKMYNLLLWEKGMVASSFSAMRAKIAASGDREAVLLLDRIAEKRTQVARITANPPGDPKLLDQALEQIVQLEQQANDLERELVKRSPTIAQQRSSDEASWEGVQAKLKAGEAAVEYVHYKFHDGKHWTGKSYYAALVVTPETTIGPTFISLGDAAMLECGPVNNYRQLVGMMASCLPCSLPTHQQGVRSSDGSTAPTAVPKTPTFYEAFWKPLEPALGNAKRIYFSTDGVLSQVSLAVVPDDSGKLLIEKYDLRPVISTKDLLREPHPGGEQTAVLIGDPKFNATIAEQQTALAALSRQQSPEGQSLAGGVEVASNVAPSPVRGSGRRSFDLQNSTWPDLPSTKIEVRQLNKLLTKPWHVEMYTEGEALEEVMKRLHGPRLLHVATHGFFLADENEEQACSGGVTTRTAAPANVLDALQPRPLKEDPMLRSGLVFTGANRIANGDATPEGMDDGILTAYEAMGLNLEGTELVVLSACETGLGQTQAGEGVFGLRRALQVAGAQSVMMTMWDVPDVETQRLMKLFYGKWLGGEEKHQALREAQLELREQIKKDTGHDSPEKWGAFVLVGP